MMKFSTLMLLMSLPFILFSQEKALNKAVKNGKNATNLTYFVEFEKYYEMDDVSKWMTEKGYNILQSSTAEFPVFGDTKVGYDKVYFMTSSDYAVFQQTLERIAAEERKKNQTVSVDWTDIILAAVVVTTGAIIYKGTEYAIKNGALSNTSSSSNSNSKSSDNTSKPSDDDIINGKTAISAVKKEGNWNLGGYTNSTQIADIEFADGVSGRIFAEKDFSRYYISNGVSNFYYKSKSDVIRALYVYKKYKLYSNIGEQ